MRRRAGAGNARLPPLTTHLPRLSITPALPGDDWSTARMNWTGGSLQRSKQANKGVVQKQKAHFARARTQLQNAPNAPAASFRPGFFQDEDASVGGRLPPPSSRSVRHTGHSKTLRDRRSRAKSPLIRDEPGAETGTLAEESSRKRRLDATTTTQPAISSK